MSLVFSGSNEEEYDGMTVAMVGYFSVVNISHNISHGVSYGRVAQQSLKYV